MYTNFTQKRREAADASPIDDRCIVRVDRRDTSRRKQNRQKVGDEFVMPGDATMICRKLASSMEILPTGRGVGMYRNRQFFVSSDR